MNFGNFYQKGILTACRYWPALRSNGNGHEFANEREILYKLFFDMKKDVTELKKMFVEILAESRNRCAEPGIHE